MTGNVLAGGNRLRDTSVPVGLVIDCPVIDCPVIDCPVPIGDLERRRGNENRGGDLGTGYSVSSGIGDRVIFDAGVGVFVGVGVGAGAGKSRLENDEETEETLVAAFLAAASAMIQKDIELTVIWAISVSLVSESSPKTGSK